MTFRGNAVVSMASYAASGKPRTAQKPRPRAQSQAEPRVPAGCIHVRQLVRDAWARAGRTAAIRSASGSSASNSYGKANGNLSEGLKQAVTIFIPTGENYPSGLQEIADVYDGARYSEEGLTVRLPAGTQLLAYSNFTQEHAWDVVPRAVATFFVDDGAFQLTVRSTGRVFLRTPGRRLDSIAPNGQKVVMGT